MKSPDWKDFVLRILAHVIAILIAYSVWFFWLFPLVDIH